MKKDVTFIIPAYNEADNLRILLPNWINYCKKNNAKIIIINDGSTDDTRKIVSDFLPSDNMDVFHHKVNRGYGAALKSGVRLSDTELLITMDADGQHNIEEAGTLTKKMGESDADMVIGSRKHIKYRGFYKKIGKFIIHIFVKMFFRLPVYDLNSGMKLFRNDLAKNYIKYCPDSMAFSDIFVLIFLSQGRLVLEQPIVLNERLSGKSTISTQTAFETIWEVLNIAMLFNPLKIFLPLSIMLVVLGVVWEIPILFTGRGLSVGASMLILAGLIFLFLALLAEQISIIIRSKLE